MAEIKILWGLSGPLRAQPTIAVSTSIHGQDETLEVIRDILASRKPKPERVDVMGGNFTPSVFAVANELHVSDKQPNIVSWLYRKIANTYKGVTIIVERHQARN